MPESQPCGDGIAKGNGRVVFVPYLPGLALGPAPAVGTALAVGLAVGLTVLLGSTVGTGGGVTICGPLHRG
jgi:hypothetical protein